MANTINLYISVSPGLVAEREALAQAAAELPVSLGWEIRHTPRAGETAQHLLDVVSSCDLYMIVLGADFAAPMGLELERARTLGKPLLAYRQAAVYTPSAQNLLQRFDPGWTRFEVAHRLKQMARRDLAGLLLDIGEQVGLHVNEVEALVQLHQRDEQMPEPPDDRRGAGEDGLILGRGQR